jgi:putative hydrolase of the HAD superfamily
MKKLFEKPTVLLFDFGGVVQELMDNCIAHLMAERLNIPGNVFLPWFHDNIPKVQVGDLTEDEFFRNLHEITGAKIPMRPSHLFLLPFSTSSKLFPAITDLLDQLVAKKIQIAVTSNTIPSHAQMNRERGNYKWFGANIFLSCDIRLLKPDAAFFDYVAGRVGSPVNQLLLIDDSDENVSCARALGITAVKHDSMTTPASILRQQLRNLGVPLDFQAEE